jgi:hypothetical protein
MEESIEKWLKSDDGLYEKYYEDYVQAPDKAKWWISKRGTFRDYPGYKQVNQKVSVAPLKDRLVKSLDEEDWAKASKAYKRDVAKELGTTVEKLDSAWDEHLEDVKKSNEIQARKDEVDKWPWYKKMVASDYAKQRYINEPEKSVFSDKGEWYNKGEDVSDLLYGGAGAVADFIPGIGGTVVGPAVRGLRDVQHKVTDSNYQKDWSQIAGDVGNDLLFNAGTDLAPTMLLRRGERYAGNAEKGWKNGLGDELKKADDYLQAKHETENIKQSTEQLGGGDWQNQYKLASNPTKWDKAVDRLPESPMKSDLKTLKDAPRNEKMEALTQWEVAAGGNPHPYIYVEKNGEEVLKPYFKDEVRPAVTEHYKKVLKGNDEAGALTKSLAGAADAWKTFGERGVKEGKNALGRGSKPEELEQVRNDRWSKGYATWDEKKSPEYKQWEQDNLKAILGLE